MIFPTTATLISPLPDVPEIRLPIQFSRSYIDILARTMKLVSTILYDVLRIGSAQAAFSHYHVKR
jgi:hypothetical protein